MKDSQKNKIIPEESWGVYDEEKTVEIANQLEAYTKLKNEEKTNEIFNDDKGLRSLIVLRGPMGRFLRIIENAFYFVLKNNSLSFEKESGTKILKLIQKKDVKEELLHLLGEIFYHQREKEKLEVIGTIITSNKEILLDKRVYYRFLHTLATWEEAVEHNSEEALKLNTEVLANTKEADPVFYYKAKYGLTYNKALLPKQKIADFIEIADGLLQAGNGYDAFRAKTEAARASLDLARQQGIQDLAFENLEKSKSLALEALKVAMEVGYPNMEIIASETLGDIYQERRKKLLTMKSKIDSKENTPREYKQKHNGMAKTFKDDERKAKSYKKRATELRNSYDYTTQYNNKYKDSFFAHSK